MSQHAAAQQTGQTIQLDTVVVETDGGDAATGPVDGYVTEATATGAKTATPIEEIPQAVSVIGRDEMDDRGAQKADEALRYTAGVFAQPFGYDSDTNWMYIRGFSATQFGAYMDGLQLYGYGFGAFFVDSNNLERIEVLKGAASVLYGGSNPGGIVNYVSKRPTGERIRELDFELSESGSAYLGFDIGDRINEAFDYRFSGRLGGGSGASDFADGWRGSISPALHWKLNDATDLTILANATRIDERHNGGAFLPYHGTVLPAHFGRIDRDANFTEPDLDTYEREQYSIGYEFEHLLDNDWTVRQNVRFAYSDLHEQLLYPYGYTGYANEPVAPDKSLERINFEHETNVSTLTADNQLEGKVDSGPINHSLLFGIDYKLFYLDQVQKGSAGTRIDVTDPDYGTAQSDPAVYLNQELTQNQLGFYAQDQLRFGDGWLVTLNGRYDRVWTDVENLLTPDDSTDSQEGAFSGRAGVAYKFANGMTPYASVATFFNPVFDTDAAGNLFAPETGQQYEVGLKYRPSFVDGLFTVALFDLTKQNVVTGNSVIGMSQIGEVRSRGIEVEAKANINKNWRVTAAFTAMDIETTKDADGAIVGKTPYVVPETQASLWLDYTFGAASAVKGLSIGGGVRYIGASWADNENTLRVPEATLFDAHLGYSRDNWGMDFNVNNLLDKVYVASCQTSLSCAYGEGGP
ncbi:TonB-dependent siderophore receptor [Breoghania sp. L-A4]|uniref:TonB-dependent siderophore receptor n=1 Tax=Breoghania sp. L-A4 TaxID=2304600 RepID=UPI0020BDFC1A|nr:TonB-dependent siderophore receptor [Breoghania sp. L-A4]